MDIGFEKINEFKNEYIEIVTDFFNYHRKLLKSPKSMYQTFEASKETLEEWQNEGEFRIIKVDDKLAGFIYFRLGGTNFAWLEDIYLLEEFRGNGTGKMCINKLEEILKENKVIAYVVNVIPRNEKALKFYIECGFDHLNMIELRKNFDKSFDKDDKIEILGYELNKY